MDLKPQSDIINENFEYLDVTKANRLEIPDISNLVTKEELITKQNVISDLDAIRSNANAGKIASDTIATYGDIVTHKANEFATTNALSQGLESKQDTISDLASIRDGASKGATALQSVPSNYVKNTDYASSSNAGLIKTTSTYATSITSSGNMYAQTISLANYPNRDNGSFISKGTLENIKESLVTSVGDTKYQPIIEDLDEIRTNAETGAGLSTQVESNTQRIEELATSKLPNATPVGTPHIVGSYVSNFSDTSYMLFPFTDISHGYPFDIYFSFTTSDDVTTQQNILDSYFGIALAIQNNKGIMALSSNGINWDIGTSVGTNLISSNTTYYVKYSWTGEQYNASISTNKESYVPDMILNSTLSPHKTTIYIGGSPNLFGAGSAHPFKGTINFKDAKVVVQGIDVWDGYADVGFQTRANVSLSNLDEAGEYRFNSKQNTIDENLTTSSKTIVGAINELNSKPSVPDLDETTINLNDTNKLQAIGVIDKNKGDVKYDWIGTQSEWEEQNIAEEYPEWLCYITDDIQDISTELNNPYSLFDCKFADHTLSNASWLLSNGQWHSGDVYIDAYNLLVEEWNNGQTNQHDELPSGNYIWYVKGQSGFKMVHISNEQYVQEAYNTTGIAWYYILDTANKRFKLPRTKWGFKGLRTDVGRGVEESLPNIKGSFGVYARPESPDGKLFTLSGTGSNVARAGDYGNYKVNLNANGYNSTYQDGAPVQERGTQMYLYFYVGETVQNANLIDAGRIAEQLTTKVDIDANNFSTTGKELITGWGFPSNRYVDLTLGASGTNYTAPANGYVVLIGTTTSAGTCRLRNLSSGYALSNGDASQSFFINLSIPVKKNDNFNWERQGGAFNINVAIFRFIYAEGAN